MRRLVDVVVSATALAALSPLLLLVAIAVAFDSRGPVFYLAPRVGQFGRVFRMWKFRTMIQDAARVGPAITGNADPRITKLGTLLRRTKIDEIPQLLNVLAGDMTLVGPRPESPDIVGYYSEAQRAVLDVKPGVTGVVQLHSGEESDNIPAGVNPRDFYISHLMPQKIQQDLDYLKTRTARTDAIVLLQTAMYVVRVCAGR
ncbi:MAG TPA: sugar transferase [Bryobacteraceae bacterium]|jgi:lipopolysaccharide/colanic/teichoic acid biosynthesis glycosyltransferase|nr:sugar transferase [Bryobacteraceae bacterium]